MNKNKGFTLIEVLVTISIIVILTGVVFINYRSGEKTLTLQRAANKLAQDIRRTQGMALAAEKCTNSTACPSPPYPVGGGVPPGGYGIYFDQDVLDSYRIYADSGSPPNNSRDNGEDIETIYLEKEVKINSVFPNPLSINFTPPDPTTTLSGGSTVRITLALIADSSKTKTITVNEAGRIDIN